MQGWYASMCIGTLKSTPSIPSSDSLYTAVKFTYMVTGNVFRGTPVFRKVVIGVPLNYEIFSWFLKWFIRNKRFQNNKAKGNRCYRCSSEL